MNFAGKHNPKEVIKVAGFIPDKINSDGSQANELKIREKNKNRRVLKKTCAILIGVILVGCNSGSNTHIGGKAPQALIKTTVAGDHADLIDAINTWWEVRQASEAVAKNAAAEQALIDSENFSVYGISSSVSDFFISGLIGMAKGQIIAGFYNGLGISKVLGSILNNIFPPKQDSQAIAFQRILDKLQIMDNKLDVITLLNKQTLGQVITQYKADQDNVFHTLNANISDNNDDIFQAMASGGQDFYDFARGYESGQFDVVMRDSHGTLVPDKFFLKMIIYLAQTKRFDGTYPAFSTQKMSELDASLNQLTNLSTSEAYGATKAKSNTLNTVTQNIDMLPNMIRALSDSIAHNYLDAFSNVNSSPYKFNDMENNNYVVRSNLNRLPAYLIFDQVLNSLNMKIIRQAIAIQRIQYLAIALRYLGGDADVNVPSAIYNRLRVEEQTVQGYINNDQPEDAATLRSQMFKIAVQMLNDSFQKRAVHLHNVLFTPDSKTYGELMLNIERGGSESNAQDSFMPINWDVIRGSGEYSDRYYTESQLKNLSNNNSFTLKDNSTFHAIQKESDDSVYYYVNNNGRVELMSISDLILKNYLYWDGYFIKTPTNSHNVAMIGSPLMQNIAAICRPDSSGVYRLKLIPNSRLLYCADGLFNYYNVKVPHFSKAKQSLTIMLPTNSNTTIPVKTFQGSYTLALNGPQFIVTLNNDSTPIFSSNGAKIVNCDGGTNILCHYQKDSYRVGYNYDISDNSSKTTLAEFVANSLDVNLANINEWLSLNNDEQHLAFIPLGSDAGVYFAVIKPGKVDSYVGLGYLTGDFYFNDYGVYDDLGFYYSNYIKNYNFNARNLSFAKLDQPSNYSGDYAKQVMFYTGNVPTVYAKNYKTNLHTLSFAAIRNVPYGRINYRCTGLKIKNGVIDADKCDGRSLDGKLNYAEVCALGSDVDIVITHNNKYSILKCAQYKDNIQSIIDKSPLGWFRSCYVQDLSYYDSGSIQSKIFGSVNCSVERDTSGACISNIQARCIELDGDDRESNQNPNKCTNMGKYTLVNQDGHLNCQ